MSGPDDKVKLFDARQVRAEWDAEAEKWWFSVVDIVAVLTDSDYATARCYWKALKGRLAAEGNETITSGYRLKLRAADGKRRLTDVADTEQILRLIQSIPSKRAEPSSKGFDVSRLRNLRRFSLAFPIREALPLESSGMHINAWTVVNNSAASMHAVMQRHERSLPVRACEVATLSEKVKGYPVRGCVA